MKSFKRISFLITTLLLMFSMSFSSIVLASTSPRAARDAMIIYFTYVNGQRSVNVLPEWAETFGGTHTIFTCHNGDYFIGFYWTSSTRAIFFNMWGDSLGYIYIGSERAFHDFVMFNVEMMRNVHSVPDFWTAEEAIMRNIAALRAEMGMPTLGMHENDNIIAWARDNQNEPSTDKRGYAIIQTDNNQNEPQVYGRSYIDIPTENVRHYGRHENNHVYVYAMPVVLQNLPSAWAFEQVIEAIGVGLVPDNLQYDYTQVTTRAEFAGLAVALYETATGTTIIGRASFNDTTDMNVQKAGYLGVVQGVGEGNFAPNNTLTREQAAVMLVRLFASINTHLDTDLPAMLDLPYLPDVFADYELISPWAFNSVASAYAFGIMGGVGDNQFAPGGDYTREQSIVTILRLFEILN